MSTLIPADVSSTFPDGNWYGYIAGTGGSLSPALKTGFTDTSLVYSQTDNLVIWNVEGNAVSALATLTGLSIDSIELPDTVVIDIVGSPTYNGGSNTTQMVFDGFFFNVGTNYAVTRIGGDGADTTPPTITSASAINNLTGTTLAHSLTANESVTWGIVGGADAADFEISGSTLRWASNGTKNVLTPDDADANNVYVVTVRATDLASNTTDQTISVTLGSLATITYVGGRTQAIAGTTSTTVVSLSGLSGGSDSSPSEGDLVLIGYAIASAVRTPSPSISSPGDYLSVASNIRGDDSREATLSVLRKFMGVSPDANLTVSATGNTADAGLVFVRVYRGVDLTTPLDVTRTTATGINTGRPNPPAITPLTAGARICVVGAGCAQGLTVFTQGGDLTDFVSVASDDTNDAIVGWGDKANWVSGPFDPAAWTGGSTATADAWAAVTLALRPKFISGELPTTVYRGDGTFPYVGARTPEDWYVGARQLTA